MPKSAMDYMKDAQSQLTFVLNQATYIEAEVEKIEYPEVQYPDLVPVDFSAPEWVKSVTYFSQDKVGSAEWFQADANDVPRADINRTKYETEVYMAAIGYGYNIEEVAQAQQAGVSLTSDKAEAAKEAYEFFVDDVALRADGTAAYKGFSGLIDYPGVNAADVAADGASSGKAWTSKTPAQIARDINEAINLIWTQTKQIGMADTVLLPPTQYAYLVETMFDTNGQMTIFDWIMKRNIYTATTGRPLTIRAVRGLETAGDGGTTRMVVYKRDPKVLKMHIPMRHRFLEAMRTGPLKYEIPGIFRLGGLDVRRPKMIEYRDEI